MPMPTTIMPGAGAVAPMAVLAMTIIGGFITLRFLKKEPAGRGGPAAALAGDIANVRDIRDGFIYTHDGHAIMCIRVMGIIVDLMSGEEQSMFITSMAADCAQVDFPFKMISVSRPVDMSASIAHWQEMRDRTGDEARRALLRHEIAAIGGLALGADTLERRHYMTVWGREDDTADIRRRALKLAGCFTGNGVGAHILPDDEIGRLVNLIHNPEHVHLEDPDLAPAIPLIEELYRPKQQPAPDNERSQP